MRGIKGWFRRNNLVMLQAQDLSRQLQEAWDEKDAISECWIEECDRSNDLVSQLHRVARERDQEREKRLAAEDKLLLVAAETLRDTYLEQVENEEE